MGGGSNRCPRLLPCRRRASHSAPRAVTPPPPAPEPAERTGAGSSGDDAPANRRRPPNSERITADLARHFARLSKHTGDRGAPGGRDCAVRRRATRGTARRSGRPRRAGSRTCSSTSGSPTSPCSPRSPGSVAPSLTPLGVSFETAPLLVAMEHARARSPPRIAVAARGRRRRGERSVGRGRGGPARASQRPCRVIVRVRARVSVEAASGWPVAAPALPAGMDADPVADLAVELYQAAEGAAAAGVGAFQSIAVQCASLSLVVREVESAPGRAGVLVAVRVPNGVQGSLACRSSEQPSSSEPGEGLSRVDHQPRRASSSTSRSSTTAPGWPARRRTSSTSTSSLPEANKGNMISLATGDDRTIFFDFLPVSALTVRGFDTRFQLYTVPGQIALQHDPQAGPARRGRRGVRGRLAVGPPARERGEPSQPRREPRASTSIDARRDARTSSSTTSATWPTSRPLDYLEYLLNRGDRRVPFFEAVATEGKGVFDTLNTVSRMVLAHEFGGRKKGAS